MADDISDIRQYYEGSVGKEDGKRRRMWLDLLFSISTRPSIVGASNHILYVGKKKDNN